MINSFRYTNRSIKIYRNIALLVIFFCAVTNFCLAQSRLVLISGAESDYHIVVPAGPSGTETEAANTLQKYLFKVSGCTLPITNEAVNVNARQLIIGNAGILQSSDTVGMQKDGILIKTVQSAIVFGGGRRKGILYSVYTFIDSMLGCKMYTQDVFQIPQMKTITLPATINIKQNPAFNYRMSCFINLSKAYCDFNKQNYYLEDWGLWVHSFGVLVPEDKYFNAHPEYFALVNGKRTPGQLCLSNPDVLQVLIANLAAKMKEKPNAKFWSVSQNDNQLYCQCDACKKLDEEQGSHQGSILNFVNKVAAHFPDKTITTLAYQYSQKPPKTLTPADNVLIMLCSINEERGKPINDYKNSQFNTDFQNWQALTNNIFIWDYLVQFSNSMSPFPNLYTLQPNIQYFHANKVAYLFEEGFSNQPSEFSELRTYLISKLMWNEHADVQLAMHNFIEAYYGKNAGPYIEEYIKILYSNSVQSNAKLYIFGAPADQRNTYLKPADIDQYKLLFQKALAATNKNDIYYKRVAKEYLSVLFAEVDVNQALLTVSKSKSETDKIRFKKMLDEWYAFSKEVNINYMSEGLEKTDDYYNNKIKFLE